MSEKNILLAKSAGFCFGVARAVRIAEETAAHAGRVKTLGPLIHNKNVEDRLASLGITRADSVSEIEKGDTVIITGGFPNTGIKKTTNLMKIEEI